MTPPLLHSAAVAPTFGLDSLFFLTLLFIFGTAIVTAIFTKWAKDKCLKFFNGDAVTLERDDGRTTWGTLRVLSSGVEVEFATPGVDPIGRRRSSVMVYANELDTKTLALFRYHDALDAREREARDRQVDKTFNPGFFRRLWRKVRVLANTLRDAFSKALGAFIGQVAKANPSSRVLSTHQASVTEIGTTLVTRGNSANAYEPLLERHIGKPVILDLAKPGGGTIGVPGYLVEYTSKFIALFNVEHEAPEALELRLPKTGDAEPKCVKSQPTPTTPAAGCAVELTATVEADRIVVRNNGFDPAVVEQVEPEAFEPVVIGAIIPPGGSLDLPVRDVGGALLRARQVRRLDVVAPRTRGIVRHAGELLPKRKFLDDLGLDELPLVPKRRPKQSNGAAEG